MPRTPRKAAAPAAPPANTIISSAARIVAGRKRGRPKSQTTGWQDEVWQMLDTVGELEFYREFFENAGSRITLNVEEEVIDPDSGEVVLKPTANVTAKAALAVLFGGEAGQATMMGQMFSHMVLPGETWLFGLPQPPDDPAIDQWRILSHAEIAEEGAGESALWVIDRGDGEPEKYRQDEAYCIRIWNPHPKKWVEANSSVRSALPILRELVGLSKTVAASTDSRLAGAGILAVPSEMSMGSPVPQEGDGADPADDPFFAALFQTITTAISDRGSADAVVPIVIKGPAEHLDKIRHITLGTPFDAATGDHTDRAIKRLANSLNIPAQVLMGLADVNHWTGWLLDDTTIKMHIEPVLNVILHGLTTRYLWPVLQGTAESFDPLLRKYRITGDTSALRQRPNRAAEAKDGHDSLVITDSAWAREVGLEADDLLDPKSPEYRRRILMRLAQSTVPEVVAAAMDALGVPIDLPTAPAAPAPGMTAEQVPAPAPAEPAAIEAPRTPPPGPNPGEALQAAAALAAAEPLVLRAVERAWNKAGRRGRTRTPVAPDMLDGAMSGAWDHAGRAANLLGLDVDAYTGTLDRYARGLLATGADHDPKILARLIVSDVLQGA